MKDIVLLEESLMAINRLSDMEAGVLLKTLIRHTEGIETDSLPEKVELIYPFVRGQVDRMLALREKNRANGALGGRPKKNPEETQTKPNYNPDITQTKPNDNPEETQPKAPKPKRKPIPNGIEKEREKKEKADLPDTGVWANDEVREAFKEYARMRVRIRKPLTPEAVRRKVPKLESLTNDPNRAVDLINQATDNCWLDFYDTTKQKADKPSFPFTQRNTDYDALLDAMGV